jgi:hypothetical protein
MNAPGGASMIGEVRAGGVVAGLGATSSAVESATTDRAMDGDVADHGGLKRAIDTISSGLPRICQAKESG